MNQRIFIYVLIEPLTNIIRYVGASKNPERRLKDHIKEANRGKKNHRYDWIRKILSKNDFPIMKIIEETNIEVWEERERYWISYYGRENLVNGTDGGDGVTGRIISEKFKQRLSYLFSGEGNPFYGKHHSEESLEKMRHKVISSETRNKIRESKRGKSNSLESREKLKLTWKERGHSFSGRKHTEESNEKNCQSHLGKPAWNKGKITNELAYNRGIKTKGKSPYSGVSKKKNGFIARVTYNAERVYLYGTSNDLYAALAYDIGAIFYYGEDSNLNFLELKENYISYLQRYGISNIKELRTLIKNYIRERSN